MSQRRPSNMYTPLGNKRGDAPDWVDYEGYDRFAIFSRLGVIEFFVPPHDRVVVVPDAPINNQSRVAKTFVIFSQKNIYNAASNCRQVLW